MKLNGTIYHLEQPIILLDLLNEYGFQTQRIAVEMNGAIIPKATYHQVTVTNDDTLEVVSFVGDESDMKLIVNGKPYITNASTLLDLKAELQIPSDVTILNGFQVSENLDIKEGDLVTLIQKGKMPSQDELESMMCARHTPNVHNKVKEAQVGNCRSGRTWVQHCNFTCPTGVGTLFLVDFDVVEPSNLNRQSYYISHLGLPKTEALKQQIAQINPFIKD